MNSKDAAHIAHDLQSIINAHGLGPPDPCKDLRAAARAVVEHRSGPFVAHHSSRPHYEVDAELLAALNAAVEAAAGQGGEAE